MERFKTQLSNVNTLFERAREWADLSNCLQKVKKVIEQNPNLPVPNKKELAKRLAQCLNPDLNVIHQLTLEVYQWIFQREISLMREDEDLAVWGADLALFYSGLFNFYQFAAFEVKRQFLKIIQDYVLKLKRELLLSLPGFLLCMLPALEDQNSDLLKQVEAILTETEKIVGTTKFFGEIWKAMLRTPRSRLSAIKFLDRRIPRNIQAAIKLIKEGKIYLSPYNYEIKMGRVQLVDHSDSLPEWFQYEKEMLDRLLTKESLEAYFFFYYPNKQKLVNNALLAGLQIVSQDIYVNRAVFDFIISHMPITGNINNAEESINIVEGALMTLVKKDFASLKKFFTWFQGHLDDETDKTSLREDPSIRYVIPALKRILYKFQKVETEQTVIINEMGIQERNLWTIHTPISIISNLLADNTTIVEPILADISVELIHYIKIFYQVDTIDSQYLEKFKTFVKNLFQMFQTEMSCLWMALGSLLKKEISQISKETHKIDAIDLIAFVLMELQPSITEKQTEELNYAQEKKEKEELAKMLIPIVSGLLSGVEQLSLHKRNLEQPALDLIGLILKKIEQQKDADTIGLKLQDSVNLFNDFYIKLSNQADQYNGMYDAYKKSSQILYRIQRYANPISFEKMPSWLDTVIKCSCASIRGTKLLLISIEVFINILESQSDDKNLKALQNLIIPKQQINSSMDIIKTLWSLLDEPEDHEKIVQLIIKFDKLLPKIFSDVVTQELNSKNREVKHRAVKKFSIFWKLTTHEYPEYKPFQPISERLRESSISNMSKQTMNELKLSQKYAKNEAENTERSYVALHNMLHILEDSDPTMRLSCRSWLSDSKSAYLRILDPLLNEFIDNNKVFVSYTGQLFFLEGYQTQIIIENFGKLRNIILNTQDEMIKYIVTSKLSNYFQMVFLKDKTCFRPKNSKMEIIHCEGKYIQAIVYITLQFIMAQAVESLDQELYQHSQTVNASAAEFMELILKSVLPYKELSQEISHIIIMPVVLKLKQSIENGNVAQQVHLLNLLKVILFECNFYSTAANKRSDSQSQISCQNAREIFTDVFFLGCICDGMKNELSFVRNAFISFSMKLVPFMRDIVDAKIMATNSTIILETYCHLLLQTDVSQYQTSKHIYQFGQKKDQRRVKFTINQENDIITIVNGLKNLVNNCLGILDSFELVEDNQIEKQLENLGKQNASVEQSSYGIFGFFKSQPVTGPQDPNIQVKEAIFNQMQNIILSCINIWNDFDLYRVRNFFFTRMGVFPYHKEDDKKMDQQIHGRDILTIGKKVIQTEKAISMDQDMFIKQNLNQIQSSIVQFLEPINSKYSFYLVKGFLEIWKTSSTMTGVGIDVSHGCDKIIQILISMQVEAHEVIDAVNKWIQLKKYDVIKEKRNVELTFEQKEKATLQSLICQFVYMYLLHTVQNNFKMIRKQSTMTAEQKQLQAQDQYLKLYQNMSKFIKNFMHAKHPNTITWIMELLYILTNRFKPDDSKLEKKLKFELYEVYDQLLRASSSIISDSFGIGYTEKYGVDSICFSPTVYEMMKRYQFIAQKAKCTQIAKRDSYLLFDQNLLAELDEIQFQKESIFQDFEQLKKFEKQNQNDPMSTFLKRLNESLIKDERNIKPIQQQEYYKCFTIITLRQTLVKLTLSIYSPEQTDLINNALMIIVAAVMKILDSHIKAISIVKENEAKKQTEVQVELLTDFLAGLAIENQILQKVYKQEITAMFNSDNFFLMSERTLRKWQQIMKNFLAVNNEVFEELLLKYNRVEGIFVSKKWEIQQKSLTFKRLAFLVYSSQINSMEEQQTDTLLKKMTEGFKNTSKDRELTIQLFLLSRILMLRLTHQQLADALRKLWPHLLNELVNVFDVSSSQDRDYLLQIEGMKIVELMSQLNIEDFHMNQWMFLFDGYGMQVNFTQDKMLIETSKQINEVFQPYLVKFMCNKSELQKDNDQSRQNYSFYHVQKQEDIQKTIQTGPNPSEFRQTVFTGHLVNPDDKSALEKEAFKYAQALQQLLTNANLQRTEIDRESAESLIEKDFLMKPRYHE